MGKNIESESMFPKSNSMRLLEKINAFLSENGYQNYPPAFVAIYTPTDNNGWTVELVWPEATHSRPRFTNLVLDVALQEMLDHLKNRPVGYMETPESE